MQARYFRQEELQQLNVISQEKNLPNYFYDPLKNWYQGGERVSEIYYATVEGGSEVIVADHYKGRRRGLKDVDFSVSLRWNVPFYERGIQKAVLG